MKFLKSSLPVTIDIRLTIADNLGTILADPIQMQQVIMNLGTNAAHAMHANGGTLTIDLMNVDLTADEVKSKPELIPGPYVKMVITDTGSGMDTMILERLFDPFFTTKRVGEGTGLGLSVVHGIIRSNGGAIQVYSEPEKGTAFHIFLPRIQATGVKDVPDMQKPLPRGTENILVVDDEKEIANILKRSLSNLGYRVVAHTSSLDALEVFRAQPDDFDLIITDQTMPALKGTDLAVRLTDIRPGIPIILCTGFSESISENFSEATGIRELLLKPVVMSKLAATVRKALDT